MTQQVAPDEVSEVVGANIRARRLQLGMTQKELADAVGTWASHVSAIESGSKILSLQRLVEWAEALQTTTAALLREPKKSA
jgi:transcriptional regulator with XRE-family HTH domain